MGIGGIFCSVVQISTIEMTVVKLMILAQEEGHDTHWSSQCTTPGLPVNRMTGNHRCKNLHYDFPGKNERGSVSVIQ